MGKKYYCDYCDKSFSNNPTNRKNHARGVHHRQAKMAHYDYFKDAETQLREDAGKRPCRTFQTNGDCPFGSSCRFSHLIGTRRQLLENEVRVEQETKKRKLEADDTAAAGDFNVREWLAKKLKTNTSDRVNDGTQNKMAEYAIPDVFKHIPRLPPSLIPPTVQSMEHSGLATWGS